MELDRASSDHAALFDQYAKHLNNNSGAFRAAFPGETSTLLGKVLSMFTALSVGRIDAAEMNAFLDTAFSKSHVYALGTMLGDTPRTRTGARVTLEVRPRSRLAARYVLPVGTRFSARGMEWHTRSEIVLERRAEVARGDAFQGRLVEDVRPANGRAFQTMWLSSDFRLDLKTLRVIIDDVAWTDVGPSLCLTPGSEVKTVYRRRVRPDGRVAIDFGNGPFGAVPASGALIRYRYAETEGARGNGEQRGDRFILTSRLLLPDGKPLQAEAVAVSPATGGDDEEDKRAIKYTSPRLYAARGTAVRRQDHAAFLMDHGDVAAAAVWGEYEQDQMTGVLTPYNMNRVRFSVLRKALYEREDETGRVALTTDVVDGILTHALLIRGAVRMTVNGLNFTDPFGNGVLASPDMSWNIADGRGTPSSNGHHVIPTGAYTALGAFDRNLNTPWISDRKPTQGNPSRLAYDFGANRPPQHVRSFRMLASIAAEEEDRNFPRVVTLFASDAAAPSLATDDDWTPVTRAIEVRDPGSNAWSQWVTAPFTRAYRHWMIRIGESYGGSRVTVKECQMQPHDFSSTIDYESGAYHVKLDSRPRTEAPVTSRYLVPDLGPTERDDLIAYLAERKHFTTQLAWHPPVCVPVTIEGEVGVVPTFDPPAVAADVGAALEGLFAFGVYSLGRVYYISDILEAMNNVPGVDYIKLRRPSRDVTLSVNEFAYVVDVLLSYTTSQRPYGSVR